ncbi:MAG: hypothetical protein IPP57_11615 [Candidatus Obscuribacter sp.]|nr:hypothetical protein [Candidatus Obscuribacter sp.]MBK7840787.1 hypothetical protein [Candidatus Obscuribacter sp.]MBK9202908.1 hypothetical protein [Candidatus Obscuribacter sp.]MBK9620999.1 hypothetical protein [Candidatus Obscuribacter sp.]MBK9771457.1 hypothetical protein [Candidatus Obscuribacter sp.]
MSQGTENPQTNHFFNHIFRGITMTGKGFDAFTKSVFGIWGGIITAVVFVGLCIVYAPWLLGLVLATALAVALYQRYQNLYSKK